MENQRKPEAKIAKRTLPPPLRESIEHIFDQQIEGVALVGGTALAGYYAGHRRSDDIDLFVRNEVSFRSAILAVKSLEKIGASISQPTQSKQYFHALCLYRKHSFTVDVVLDENLFQVGSFELSGKTCVASLKTLLRMKIATLVSRASEKDLFDVRWLLQHFSSLTIPEWISLGQSIDKGVSGENLMASIGGTTLRKEACGFSTDPSQSADLVFKELVSYQRKLVRELITYLKSLPTPPLGKLVKRLK